MRFKFFLQKYWNIGSNVFIGAIKENRILKIRFTFTSQKDFQNSHSHIKKISNI